MEAMTKERDVNDLLDDLTSDPEMRKRWALEPEAVARDYYLTAAQTDALLTGDVDRLVVEGLADRHVQEMRVSW
jgi:hypothetical protein